MRELTTVYVKQRLEGRGFCEFLKKKKMVQNCTLGLLTLNQEHFKSTKNDNGFRSRFSRWSLASLLNYLFRGFWIT